MLNASCYVYGVELYGTREYPGRAMDQEAQRLRSAVGKRVRELRVTETRLSQEALAARAVNSCLCFA